MPENAKGRIVEAPQCRDKFAAARSFNFHVAWSEMTMFLLCSYDAAQDRGDRAADGRGAGAARTLGAVQGLRPRGEARPAQPDRACGRRDFARRAGALPMPPLQ